MKTCLFICAIIFVLNALTILDASMQSGVTAALGELITAMEFPWVRMVFGDLVSSFILVSAWVFYREKDNLIVSIPLVVAYWLLAGNILLVVYIAIILFRNGGDVNDLLLGRNA